MPLPMLRGVVYYCQREIEITYQYRSKMSRSTLKTKNWFLSEPDNYIDPEFSKFFQHKTNRAFRVFFYYVKSGIIKVDLIYESRQ